jgi:hypothetical protein
VISGGLTFIGSAAAIDHHVERKSRLSPAPPCVANSTGMR